MQRISPLLILKMLPCKLFSVRYTQLSDIKFDLFAQLVNISSTSIEHKNIKQLGCEILGKFPSEFIHAITLSKLNRLLPSPMSMNTSQWALHTTALYPKLWSTTSLTNCSLWLFIFGIHIAEYHIHQVQELSCILLQLLVHSMSKEDDALWQHFYLGVINTFAILLFDEAMHLSSSTTFDMLLSTLSNSNSPQLQLGITHLFQRYFFYFHRIFFKMLVFSVDQRHRKYSHFISNY